MKTTRGSPIILKMKKKLLNFLIWLISKLDYRHFKRCSIGTKIEIDSVNYISDDNKWHKVNYSIEYFIKVGKETKIKEDVFIDDIMLTRENEKTS